MRRIVIAEGMNPVDVTPDGNQVLRLYYGRQLSEEEIIAAEAIDYVERVMTTCRADTAPGDYISWQLVESDDGSGRMSRAIAGTAGIAGIGLSLTIYRNDIAVASPVTVRPYEVIKLKCSEPRVDATACTFKITNSSTGEVVYERQVSFPPVLEQNPTVELAAPAVEGTYEVEVKTNVIIGDDSKHGILIVDAEAPKPPSEGDGGVKQWLPWALVAGGAVVLAVTMIRKR
jgi:hypothetical protein